MGSENRVTALSGEEDQVFPLKPLATVERRIQNTRRKILQMVTKHCLVKLCMEMKVKMARPLAVVDRGMFQNTRQAIQRGQRARKLFQVSNQGLLG